MIQKLQRPLNENERRCLSRLFEVVPRIASFSKSFRWLALWTSILGICVFLFARGLFRPGGPSGIWMVIIPITCIFGISAFYCAYMVFSGYLRLLGYARRFNRDQAPKIRAALDDGRASVLIITSDRVVVIEEYEDEGLAYIYDLGDGTSLFLRGEDYFPEEEDAPWPARQFEIVRSSLNGKSVGIFAGREAPAQIRKIAMAKMPQSFCLADEPKTETILQGEPDEILRKLGCQTERRSG
jgi:hypothetical protein